MGVETGPTANGKNNANQIIEAQDRLQPVDVPHEALQQENAQLRAEVHNLHLRNEGLLAERGWLLRHVGELNYIISNNQQRLQALGKFLVKSMRSSSGHRRSSNYYQGKASELEKQVGIDPLTKLPDQEKYNEELERRVEEVKRVYDSRREQHRKHPAMAHSVIFMDVDNFKQVNDHHGHLAGNQALVAIAGLLQSTLRRSDLPYRWGGEEFAIILPNTNHAAAYTTAEKLRETIASTRLQLQDSAGDTQAHSVTASFGVASITREQWQMEAYELTAAADNAVLAAKERGRNQTVSAEEFGQPHSLNST